MKNMREYSIFLQCWKHYTETRKNIYDVHVTLEMFLGSEARPARKDGNLSAIYEPTV
jgi:hypothetical protein